MMIYLMLLFNLVFYFRSLKWYSTYPVNRNITDFTLIQMIWDEIPRRAHVNIISMTFVNSLLLLYTLNFYIFWSWVILVFSSFLFSHYLKNKNVEKYNFMRALSGTKWSGTK